MQKQWILKQVDPSLADTLSSSCGISTVVATIISSRNFTDPAAVNSFLSPSLSGMLDPFLMADMEPAVERLITARKNAENLSVYGDYDVDGISSTAMLVSALKAMGFRAQYHIPNRMEDGYGLNREALGFIKESGVNLVISVDCGVTAIEEALFCRDIGLDLIITDHHLPQDGLPEALAVINPRRSDCRYPFKSLAGVGVAFNLLVALRNRLREQGAFNDDEPDLRQWLDLVALGTIADLVPLVEQNRLLVVAGLQRMDDSCRTGLAALKKVAGVKGKVGSGQVAFQLAPRLNAAGRLESAVPGVELLLTDDPVYAALLADELDAANAERRQVERQIFKDAVSMIEGGDSADKRQSIVLSSPEWHQGVVGIVASRLVERYYRPAILVALIDDSTGKGSGRSINGIHLLELLDECSEYLERYGGHSAAAGLTIKSEALPAFSEAFEHAVKLKLGDKEPIPQLLIDAELQPKDLTLNLANEIQGMEPFGMGNQTPLFLIKGMKAVERRCFGEGNLLLRLERDGLKFKAIGWGMAEVGLSPVMDLACAIKTETWNGSEQLRLEIKDLRAAV